MVLLFDDQHNSHDQPGADDERDDDAHEVPLCGEHGVCIATASNLPLNTHLPLFPRHLSVDACGALLKLPRVVVEDDGRGVQVLQLLPALNQQLDVAWRGWGYSQNVAMLQMKPTARVGARFSNPHRVHSSLDDVPATADLASSTLLCTCCNLEVGCMGCPSEYAPYEGGGIDDAVAGTSFPVAPISLPMGVRWWYHSEGME